MLHSHSPLNIIIISFISLKAQNYHDIHADADLQNPPENIALHKVSACNFKTYQILNKKNDLFTCKYNI